MSVRKLALALAALAFSVVQAAAQSGFEPQLGPNGPSALSQPGGGITGLNFGILASSGGNSGATTNGAGYAPGDLVTIAGGTTTDVGILAVIATQAVSGTVAAGGTGGTNGACTVTGTTGTGTPAQFTGTVVGNALTGPLTVAVAGNYTVNPTTPTAEPVTGCGLTGAQVNMTMGILQWQVVNPGHYTIIPINPVAQSSVAGTGGGVSSGSGATFTLSWGPIAAGIDFGNLATGGNMFLGGNGAERAGKNQCAVESTFVGDKAGYLATCGNSNTAFGHGTLGGGNSFPTMTTGSGNTCIGQDACRNATSAANNSMVGGSAGHDITTGSSNTYLGTQAGFSNQTSNSNTMIGSSAGVKITGANNTFVGSGAGSSATGGGAQGNATLGLNTGAAITTGSVNLILGASVGSALTTGSRNILMGTNGCGTDAVGTNDQFKICQSDGSAIFMKGSLATASPGLQINSHVRISKTSNYTVLASDGGAHFDNVGASGEVDFTLPTPAVGLHYNFCAGAAQTLKIIPASNTTQTINIGGSATTTGGSGNITASAIGACVEIEAISTTKWLTLATPDKTQWTVN